MGTHRVAVWAVTICDQHHEVATLAERDPPGWTQWPSDGGTRGGGDL